MHNTVYISDMHIILYIYRVSSLLFHHHHLYVSFHHQHYSEQQQSSAAPEQHKYRTTSCTGKRRFPVSGKTVPPVSRSHDGAIYVAIYYEVSAVCSIFAAAANSNFNCAGQVARRILMVKPSASLWASNWPHPCSQPRLSAHWL